MRKIILLLAVIAVVGCRNNMRSKHLPYPETRMDSVVENYHGTKVADPYRWLEDDNSAETAAWVEAQNKVTFDYLGKIPYREEVRKRLTELWNYERYSMPTKAGEYYFFLKNDGLQNQAVVYRREGLDGDAEVFLDPNELSQNGTVALASLTFSPNGRYMAYSLADSGSDWVSIKVRNCESGEDMDDRIEWVKFSGAAWDGDSRGFYYSRYDKPAEGSELSGQNRFQKVYYHRLGDAQQNDKLIYEDPTKPLQYFFATESEDGNHLFLTIQEGTHGSEILYRPTGSSQFKTLLQGFENDYDYVDTVGDVAMFMTNQNAPNSKLIGVDLRTGRQHEVISENPDLMLQNITSVGGYLMATYLQDAVSKVLQYDMKGGFVRVVDLPMIGSASGYQGKEKDTETFFMLSNFIQPPSIYRYDLASGSVEPFAESKVKYNPDKFTVDQVFFQSKDQTLVPMFIVHRKDMKLDGHNPVYMYGYGGFNVGRTPWFDPLSMLLIEQGVVYVVVNLRGGNEYGEKWHRAGMLENKQNVFDDFISAAEYLVDHKYTSPQKIAIAGGSNGGLLVGACMTQRPDLFGVAFPAVGVLDMLRYHKFTVGWGWAVEYGSSEDPQQFEYLYRYSPLHNVRPGTSYPATLITTGDHDDRVVPAHSFKFAAALQAAQAGDKPTLIRIDTNAGHGAGKPTSKRIDEAADVCSFFLWNTDAEVKLAK